MSVGRLTKQKNYKYLVNEFKNFLKYSDDYNLMILGDGEEKNELNKLIKNLNLQDRVHLIGRVENVYEYMKQADVFVLSSLWEELGFVIVEAAFNNLFVISSDCPNGPKEFIDKNKCGILFQSNSFNSLTEAMIKFLKIENTFNVKLNAKKKSSLYTKFNHHLELTKILQNEN